MRRQRTEAFFIGRSPRIRRATALAEITRLLDEDGGEQQLRTALAADLPAGRADQMSADEVAETIADGVASGRFVLIGLRPQPVWAPTFAEAAGPEGEDAPPPAEDPAEEEDWLEIELLDDGDPPRPVAGARFLVELKDGTIVEGTLDEEGKAMVEGIKKGATSKVSFPDMDAKEWK